MRKTIALTLYGPYIELWIEKYGRTRRMWLHNLLREAADDPRYGDALESILTETLARLRATREREAGKIVSLADRREPMPAGLIDDQE
jgi:hypothetical protein